MGDSTGRQGAGRASSSRGVGADPNSKGTSRFIDFPPPNGTPFVCASIYFEFDKADLGYDEYKALNRVAGALALLSAWDDKVSCLCTGRADVRGTFGYNVSKSGDRASSVRNYVLWKLPPNLRLYILTSARSTLDSHADAEKWAEDRRVDVTIMTQPSRRGVGFEYAEESKADIFVKEFEHAEVNNGGIVLVWMQKEVELIKEVHEETYRYGWKSMDLITPVISDMSLARFVNEGKLRAAAYVHVEYELVRGNAHRVTARILDPATSAPLFPEVAEAGTDHKAVARNLYDKLRNGFPTITARVMGKP